jgi:hypothetical protein
MSRDEWIKRVNFFNEKLEAPEIQEWWSKNEHKLYDPKFMPEYPLSEKLPLKESPSLYYEELRSIPRSVMNSNPVDQPSFILIVEKLLDGAIKLGMDMTSLNIIKYYWFENLSVEEIKTKMSITEKQIDKALKSITLLIKTIAEEELEYCIHCHKYYIGMHHKCVKG